MFDEVMSFNVLFEGKSIYEGEESFDTCYAESSDELMQYCFFDACECIEENIGMGLFADEDIDLGNFSILINNEDEYPISRKDYDEYLDNSQ